MYAIGNDHAEIFNNIYKNDIWQGGSGPGSLVENVRTWTLIINSFIKEKNIASILDLGCGDGQWVHLLDLSGSSYLGVDVSDEALKIFGNRNLNNKISYVHDNILNFNYPQVDLIIIKHVLQHLPNNEIKQILKNIKDSGCKYAIICEDFSSDLSDIDAGGFRGINLLDESFDIEVELIHSYVIPKRTEINNVYLYVNKLGGKK